MKENIYDNEVFFEKYSQMERSKYGLESAGEWETLKKLLPDFYNKRVLDLGCGYGWHCDYAVKSGAKNVVGVDISDMMITRAKESVKSENVQFIRCALEDTDFEDNSFDVVISSLVLHYIKSFDDIAKKVYKFLSPEGVFIFSCEHPIFTSRGDQQWIYDERGRIVYFPVDNYFYEGKREALFLKEKVIKYHKTLTTYLNGLLENGFEILNVVEPMPPNGCEDLKDEMRRPIMLIVKAIKKPKICL